MTWTRASPLASTTRSVSIRRAAAKDLGSLRPHAGMWAVTRYWTQGQYRIPLVLPQSNRQLSTGARLEWAALEFQSPGLFDAFPKERNMRAATLNGFFIISTL